MKTSSRYLRLVWLAAEMALSTVGIGLLAHNLLNAQNLPQEQTSAMIACMVLLSIVFASACSQARRQKLTREEIA